MSKKVLPPDLIRMRERNEKIVVLTAYDYTFARLFDASGVDVILVGDSLGTVIQGQETTLPVTVEEICYHSRAVVRGVSRALVVADLPFMSYQTSPAQALETAGIVLKTSGVGAVKLEGGRVVAEAVAQIVRAGIPVMGHIGLTPQRYYQLGGYKVQGRTPAARAALLEDALALEAAGAFSVVLEGVPSEVASEITSKLTIPTIGIGAGAGCSGQVLVSYDLLGLTHFASGKMPKFVSVYAPLGDVVTQAVGEFCRDVRSGEFPDSAHSYSTFADE